MLNGAEVIVDRDCVAALLANSLHADFLVIPTDLPAVIAGLGTHTRNRCTTPPWMTSAEHFAQGPMGPNVATTCHFERLTGNVAMIGALTDIADVIAGTAGTRIAAWTAAEPHRPR